MCTSLAWTWWRSYQSSQYYIRIRGHVAHPYHIGRHIMAPPCFLFPNCHLRKRSNGSHQISSEPRRLIFILLHVKTQNQFNITKRHFSDVSKKHKYITKRRTRLTQIEPQQQQKKQSDFREKRFSSVELIPIAAECSEFFFFFFFLFHCSVCFVVCTVLLVIFKKGKRKATSEKVLISICLFFCGFFLFSFLKLSPKVVKLNFPLKIAVT